MTVPGTGSFEQVLSNAANLSIGEQYRLLKDLEARLEQQVDRFAATVEQVELYAGRYDQQCSINDRRAEQDLRGWFANNRYLDREHFLELCFWKSPRPIRLYRLNDETRIIELTRAAMASSDERVKMESLLGSKGGLKGVGYPVASVILHFAHPDRYMILDRRALWSLGWSIPVSYDLRFWVRYTAHVRGLASSLGLELRTLDKALWQFSREKERAHQ